jgi:DNA-binding NtrC family response regulator/tetratricopeptide (TPR) repeat protein
LHVVADGESSALPILRRLAECLERQGHYDDSLQVLETASIFLTTGDPVEVARLHLVRGKALLERGRHEEATSEARLGLKTLQERTSDDLLLEEGFLANLLGGCAYRQGRVQEASSSFRRALSVFKSLGRVREMALAYNNLGHVAKRRGEWDQALELYQVSRNLSSTEGASRDRVGALLNLAYVKLHQGRLKESGADFQTAAQEAKKVGDTVRWIRATLGRVQVSRTLKKLDEARELLRSLEEEGPIQGGRESVLARIEEAWIQLEEGCLEEVRQNLSRVYEIMATGSGWGGDLKGELQRLEGWAELSSGRPARALELFRDAAASSSGASDPVGVDAARLGRGVTLRHLQQIQTSQAEIKALVESLRSRGERVSLGRACLELGLTMCDRPQERASALHAFEEATRLFQEVGAPHMETEAWLAQGRWFLDEGDLEAARVRMSLARQAKKQLTEDVTVSGEDDLRSLLSKAFEQRANSGLSGFDVFRRVESTLHRDNDTDALDSLRDVLGVVREALDADGVLYGILRGRRVEILGSRGIARLDGRRALPLKALVPERDFTTDRARILVGLDPDLDGTGNRLATSQSSAVVAPVDLGDGVHILYGERLADSGRPSFQPGEAHYASALAMELAHGLRRSGWRQSPEFSELLQELSRNIYLADIVTENPRILRILELILRVAPTNMTILLCGETGTGKRLLAQAIHRVSPRSQQPFVTVDCAALPESLLESELFGYRKGAFTGASQDRLGLFEEADGGTIFLDEIDKAGVQVQRRFLHLLDTGEIRAIGSNRYRRLNVRIVAATSCPDLSKEVEEGRFLKDLYYRMNDITISVPPLRERRDDICLLAETFVDVEASRQGRQIEGMSPSFLQALLSHLWPGNVRELEKAIRRAVTLAEDESFLTPDLLPEEIVGKQAPPPVRRSRNPLKDRVQSVERDVILATLEQVGWNKSRAARLLGLSRKGLRNKIERYRLERRTR